MADERIEILGRVPLFDGLPAGELAAVANAAKERRYDTGDVIVGEGEGGIGFFVIAEGTARVEAHGERRGTLGPGASFGEVALLDEGGGRRTASVIAESPVRAQHPQIAVKVAKILARRLREAEERATPAS